MMKKSKKNPWVVACDNPDQYKDMSDETIKELEEMIEKKKKETKELEIDKNER